jgi:hypothetical protein
MRPKVQSWGKRKGGRWKRDGVKEKGWGGRQGEREGGKEERGREGRKDGLELAPQHSGMVALNLDMKTGRKSYFPWATTMGCPQLKVCPGLLTWQQHATAAAPTEPIPLSNQAWKASKSHSTVGGGGKMLLTTNICYGFWPSKLIFKQPFCLSQLRIWLQNTKQERGFFEAVK